MILETRAGHNDYAVRLRRLIEPGPLPDPGGGATAQRFNRLTEVSRVSLPLGRLFEGHADAVTILHEAGRTEPGGLGAVWASDDPHQRTTVRSDGVDSWIIDGTKPLCSGAPLVQWALVTARANDGDRLVLIDMAGPGVTVPPSNWVGAGMRDADTRSVVFESTPVAASVGGVGWYLDRSGFWHGAVGVAACWLGGALGLIDTLRHSVRNEDPHGLAHLGESEAEAYAVTSSLAQAARAIDRRPSEGEAAYERALLVRAVTERACRAIADDVAVALGPRPLAMDETHSQRVADLQVYIRQHHGRRDLEALGRITQKHGVIRC